MFASPTNTRINLSVIADTLAAIRSELEQGARERAAIARKLEARPRRLARGSTPPAVRIGDDTSTGMLATTVAALLAIKPTALMDLVAMTGARRNRISGVLAKMVAHGEIRNVGNGRRALWVKR